MPITICVSEAEAESSGTEPGEGAVELLASGQYHDMDSRTADNVNSFFKLNLHFSNCLLFVDSLCQNRNNNDCAGNHKPPRLGNRVDTQHLLQVGLWSVHKHGEAHTTTTTHHACPADDGHADG